MNADFQKARILIADDNSVVRNLIKTFYHGYGFKLAEAINGQQAVEMARACMPDLILMDIQMPVLNGYEAASILKHDKAVKAIPILVITSLEGGEVASRLKDAYDGYVKKPFKKLI